MNRRVAHLLTRMYPRRWRERYGEEFEDFLLEDRADLKTWMDVMRGAVGEHIHPTDRRRDERVPDDTVLEQW